MKVAAVLFFVSAIGSALTPNLEILILFRIIGGLGVGVASVIAPAYIAEIAPARIRGRLGSLQQLAIVTGIFLSLLVDFVLAHVAGGAGETLWLGLEAWRWMFMAMAVPAVLYGALALTIPESPRYLVATHRIPEARKVLTALLGEKNLDITLDRIQRSLDRDTPPSWKDLKRPGGGIYPIVWVGLLLSVFQQLVGINVIFYYSNILWQAVGFSESDSFVITVITSVVNIATTLIAIATVDRFGRKPLLIIGSTGMTIALGTMAVIFGSAPVGADGTRRGRPDCPHRRQRLRHRLRDVVGAGRVGAAGRDVPQPHPRRGALAGRRRPVGRKLGDHRDLPGSQGDLARAGLRLLRGVRPTLPALRRPLRPGDQGPDAGGHGRRARGTVQGLARAQAASTHHTVAVLGPIPRPLQDLTGVAGRRDPSERTRSGSLLTS